MKRFQVVVHATKKDFAIIDIEAVDSWDAHKAAKSAIFAWHTHPKLRKFGAEGWMMEIDVVEEIVFPKEKA